MTAGRTLDPTILREYDIRGLVGDTLETADIEAIGAAFATIMAGLGLTTVAVGYDGRHSSPGLEAALCEVLAGCGCEVHRIGCGPTPMLYFATHQLATDAGMMITGSHNPPDYNGIKMVLAGQSFYGADIQELGEVAARGDFAQGPGNRADVEVAKAYTTRLMAGFRPGRELSVAWDPGNGASGDIVKALVAGLSGRHVLINETIDGDFPAHHPDPTVEANLEQLKEVVAGEKCDLGIAFDGDGDRIGVVDNRGRVMWGDQLMVLFARDVLGKSPGATIIADVKASQVLFDEIAAAGGRPLMWKSGHSLIKAKMAATGAPLAGEMSGHIFFADDYYGYDDALYAAVRLLSILGQTEHGLAAIRDALPQMVNTPELRFPCPEARKFAVIAEVRKRLDGIPGLKLHDIDGVRVETDDGWWLLRASNTQAVLVARCEAEDAEGLARLKAEVAEQLRASDVAPPDEF